MVKTILVTLIAGVLLLILEYRTGLFAEKTPMPDIRPVITRILELISGTMSSISQKIQDVLDVLFPILVIVVNYFLLIPEARLYTGVTVSLILALIVIGILATKIFKQPIGEVTAFLIFVNIIAVLIVIPPNLQQLPLWPTSFKISDPDISNAKTVSIVIVVTAISVIWIVAIQLTNHVNRVRGQLEESLELLYDAPEISKMLEANERRLLERVISMWEELLEDSGSLGDLIRHSVPVRFESYTLTLGCLTDKEVKDITNARPIPGKSQTFPPFQVALEKKMQEFFGISRLRILCEKINQDEYIVMKRLLEQTGSLNFHQVALDQIANANLEANYYDPPFGEQEFAGIPFIIKRGEKGIFNTSRLNTDTITLILDEPVREVASIHLLINAGNTSKQNFGKKIGEISLVFEGNGYQVKNLILGKNIREWAPGNAASGSLIDTISDSSSQLVWEGKNQAGNEAIIDLLQIDVLKQNQEKLLQQVVISKTSTVQNSAFMISAITLKRNIL